jgi:hypothetical protein
VTGFAQKRQALPKRLAFLIGEKKLTPRHEGAKGAKKNE